MGPTILSKHVLTSWVRTEDPPTWVSLHVVLTLGFTNRYRLLFTHLNNYQRGKEEGVGGL